LSGIHTRLFDVIGLPAGTTTAAAIASAATVAIPRSPLRLGTRLVDVERPAVQFSPVELRDCGFGITRFGHFDESKAPRLPGVTVGDNIYALYCAIVCESGVKIVLGGLIAEITDKDIGHGKLTSFSNEIVSVGLLQKPNANDETVGGQKALADDTDADKDNSSIAGLVIGSYLWE